MCFSTFGRYLLTLPLNYVGNKCGCSTSLFKSVVWDAIASTSLGVEIKGHIERWHVNMVPRAWLGTEEYIKPWVAELAQWIMVWVTTLKDLCSVFWTYIIEGKDQLVQTLLWLLHGYHGMHTQGNTHREKDTHKKHFLIFLIYSSLIYLDTASSPFIPLKTPHTCSLPHIIFSPYFSLEKNRPPRYINWTLHNLH